MMHPFFARNFRKPTGLVGSLVANIMAKQNMFVYSSIDQFADIEDGMELFEIGYGPGAGLKYLLARHDVTIDGLDFSTLMFKRAKRKNGKSLRNGKIHLEFGDFALYEPNGKKYDRVYFANVTYFWKDLQPHFEKIRSMLKDDGKLVFYMSNKSALEKNPMTSTDVFNRHDVKDVLDCIKAIGFKDAVSHVIVDDTGDRLILEARK